NKKQVAANMVRGAFDQLVEDGLIHADPHPGNVRRLPDNRFPLLAVGSAVRTSFAMRETLVVLVVSIGMRDADTIARLLYRVGIPKERVLLHQLRDAIASVLEQYTFDRGVLANTQAVELLSEIFQIAARYKVRIPSEY